MESKSWALVGLTAYQNIYHCSQAQMPKNGPLCHH